MSKNRLMPWPTKKLGEVCDFVFGYSFRAEDFNEAGRGLPVIRIGDIDRGITEKFYDKEYDKKYLVEKGAILTGLSGTIKVDIWRGGAALLNQRIVKICNFKPDVLEGFIFYQLPSILKRLEIQIAQGTVKNILLPHLSNLKVLVPPLKIQHQIVERLDVIKKAQELNDKQIALAEELFQSLLNKELNPKGKNWEIKNLREVTRVESGGTPATKNLEYWNGKILWLTPKELSNFQDIEIYDTERKITELGLNHSSAKLLPTGTVLLTSRAPIGYVAIAGKPMATNQGFKNFICKKEFLNNRFLYFFLKYKTKEIRSLGRGATFGEVSKTIVSNIKIPLPPIETQRRIVEKLSAVQEYKKKLVEQKQKFQELFDSVLNKSFKGQL